MSTHAHYALLLPIGIQNDNKSYNNFWNLFYLFLLCPVRMINSAGTGYVSCFSALSLILPKFTRIQPHQIKRPCVIPQFIHTCHEVKQSPFAGSFVSNAWEISQMTKMHILGKVIQFDKLLRDRPIKRTIFTILTA